MRDVAVLLFAASCVAASMQHASAAALQVSPIRLDLSADKPAAVLTLHNEGDVPLDAQVRVFAWSQSPDDDRLDATSALMAVPPIVTVAPNADQTVRIMRVDRTPATQEQTYRLLIDEIPDEQRKQSDGVRVQLRYSVPVFVDANDAVDTFAPKLSFSLERASSRDSANVLMLRASNGTDVHAQLSRVRLDWPDGRSSTVSDGLLGYALAHTARRWRVPDMPDMPAHATGATLRALVNGEPVEARVTIESH